MRDYISKVFVMLYVYWKLFYFIGEVWNVLVGKYLWI